MPRRTKKKFEPSLAFLLLANIITIIQAVMQEWSLANVMWIYCGQSIAIGFFNWRRLRSLKRFSTSGILVNGKLVTPTKKTQRQLSAFFALHYGFFHLIYIFFLLVSPSKPTGSEIRWILVFILIFFVNHGLSFRTHVKADLEKRRNIGTLMFFPYARVLPMHITLVVGTTMWDDSTHSLLLFLGLKTIADLIMHGIEHKKPRKRKIPDLS